MVGPVSQVKGHMHGCMGYEDVSLGTWLPGIRGGLQNEYLNTIYRKDKKDIQLI